MGILRSLACIGLLLLLFGLTGLEADTLLSASDPVLYAINSNVAQVTAMAVDAAGNLYLTGFTNSTAFPATPGAAQPSFGGGSCLAIGPIGGAMVFPCYDAFVVKLDRTGKVIYATYLGGNGNDSASAIAVDAAGNAYVAGTTGTNVLPNGFPTTPGSAFPTANQGSIDGFVAKLNPSGTALVYSTLLPGAGWRVGGIAVDQTGAAYVAAGANPGAGGTFPTTAGAFQTNSSGRGTEVVVTKLNPAGSALMYGTYLGGRSPAGSGGDFPGGIAVDPSGNVYVTGTTIALDFPVTPGAIQTQLPNPRDAAFVSKLNPAGTALIYSTYLGGSYSDNALAGKVDTQGNAYILGSTSSKDFPTTPGALQPSGPNASWGTDYQRTFSFGAFLSRLNADGTALTYSTYLQGASVLDVDPLGNIYVAGQADRGFPVTAGADQRCMAGGGADIFVARFTPDGKLARATYLGGSGGETPNAIAAAPDGSVYVAGTTNSTDFPGLSGNTAAQGVQFVARLRIADPQKQNGPCMALALQNAASFREGPVAPGEIVTLRGAGFGPDEAAFEQTGPDGKVSTELAGVRVFFDDVPAPLLYVQSRQINAIAPWEIAGKAVTQLRVEFNGVPTNTASIPVAEAAPGIFHANFVSSQGAILNEDMTLNSPANRAKRGSVIAIFGTGGGLNNPMGVTGGFWPADPLAQLSLPVSVKIGGLDAEVVYAGAAPTLVSGFFQINVRVPEALASNAGYPVELTIGGVRDRALTAVAIE